jgi:hypothetical protein
MLARAWIGITMMLIAACAGNGDGLNASGQPLEPGSGNGTPPLSADFDSIQANIFTPVCSACHAGGGAPEGLRLDAANSYGLLVGVPSTEDSSVLRVKPSDPLNSYLIQKLQGHAAVGAQMPFGGPYLSAATIAFIQQWITNGAPPSSSSAAAVHFAITAVVPDAAEPVSTSPPQIMIAFNHDLDVTQIDMRAARIEKLASGAPTSVIETIPGRIAVASDNLKALMVWPVRALSAGHYRVVLHTNAQRLFTDLAGESIGAAQSDAGEPVIAAFDVEGPR